MNKRIEDIIKLGKNLGLNPFQIVFETIERSTMHNVCAYGLPTRARHWSYGRSYDHMKTYGEMGLSKVYEVILNNDPSYAFLLDTNSEVQNLFIVAHCLGHCFVPGTLIETAEGSKPIESITIQDEVLTHMGKYRNPMTLSKRFYIGKLIDIKIGSQSVQCTPEHPFLIVRHESDEFYNNYRAEWIKAKDIKEKDFVLFPKDNVSTYDTKRFEYLNYEWFDKDYMYTPVVEVTKFDGETEVFNIEVPKDSSYVLSAGAITHNSDFFKNNYMFKSTDKNMISHAAEHAGRIESYIERYGFEKVEHMMDIGFALDSHIDWHKGLYRNKYPQRKIETIVPKYHEFDDLLNRNKNFRPIKKVINKRIPPYPEKDLLWFLINYAPLENWEADVLDIIREESYYFYPQKITKIINEGFASYWHAEIMYQYDGLSPIEYMDFVRDHEKVVQPGNNPFRINPYFLGYKIFKDIEKRWDNKYGKGAGKKKIFEVRENENDISFLRNYLTADLVRDLKLFTYGYVEGIPKNYKEAKHIEIKGRILDDIVEGLTKSLYNNGVPKITINEIGQDGSLILKHNSEEVGILNQKYAAKTVEYIWDLWAAPIELHTLNDDGNDIILYFDEGGVTIKKLEDELNFEEC